MKKLILALFCLCTLAACGRREYTALDFYRAIRNHDMKTARAYLKAHDSVPELDDSERYQLSNELSTDDKLLSTTDMQPLLLAAICSNTEIIPELLSRGVPLEAVNSMEQTALILSCIAGSEAAARMLLDAGAAVDARDWSQYTALFYAAEGNHPALIRLLAERGANLEKSSQDGWTALFIAAESDAFEAAQCLLELGARADSFNTNGLSPLWYAIDESTNLELVRLLAEHGAPLVSAANEYNIIDHALKYERTDIIATLIAAGAVPDGYAFRWAINNSEPEIVRMLIGAGADTGDKEALPGAVSRDNAEIVRLLLEAGTPIDDRIYAVKSPAILQLFLDFGADIFQDPKKLVKKITTLPDSLAEPFFQEIRRRLELDSCPSLLVLDENVLYPLLYAAARSGRLELITRAEREGIDIKKWPPVLDSTNKTLLAMAAMANAPDLAAHLLAKGFNVHYAYDEALHTAVQKENALPLITLLLDAGAKVNAETPGFQEAPLHNSRAEYIPLLIEKGAEVDRKDWYGRTPLKKALTGQPAGIDRAVALVNAGADPYMRDQTGLCAADLLLDQLENPQDAVAWNEFVYAVSAREKAGKAPLQFLIPYAASYEREKAVYALADLGASVVKTGADGETALMTACGNNSVLLAAFLAERGVSLNAQDAEGDTALMYAVRAGAKDAVVWLAENGADMTLQNNQQRTVLQTAKARFSYSRYGERPDGEDKVNVYEEILVFLQEKAGGVNARDKNGETALLRAVRAGETKRLSELLAAGADPDMRVKAAEPRTVLNEAIKKGDYGTAKLLIEGGANVEIYTELLYYDAIAAAKDPAMLELLIKSGAPVNKSTAEWTTPLLFAIRENNLAMVKLLIESGGVFYRFDRIGFPMPYDEEKTSPEIQQLIRKKRCWVDLHGVLPPGM